MGHGGANTDSLEFSNWARTAMVMDSVGIGESGNRVVAGDLKKIEKGLSSMMVI